MANSRGFQFGLVLMIMVAMTGLIGFVIIYHYASLERPMQHFAIVIDAGSTQTRSNLFTINLDVASLVKWTNEIDHDEMAQQQQQLKRHLPLTKLFQVKQVGSCPNGPPLASLSSQTEAQELIDKCLREFGPKIKWLDIATAGQECDEDVDPDLHEAAASHRVDSVTHLYLGATAGMRALGELNETRATERIDWINQAIDRSTEVNNVRGPAINKGFVGIISGSDEASFGWTSVNFLCETLEAGHGSAPLPPPKKEEQQQHLPETKLEKAAIVFKADDAPALEVINDKVAIKHDDGDGVNQRQAKQESVGTLELGGTSAQMAFRLGPSNHPDPSLDQDDTTSSSVVGKYSNSSFQLEELKLFNGKYSLATRSDLCLGMSQAILRANFVILRDHFLATTTREPQHLEKQQFHNESHLELMNPCLQNSSQTHFQGPKLADFLDLPCLVVESPSSVVIQDGSFKSFIYNKSTISFAGTGNTDECSKLLTNLIEPHLCAKYFSLCPKNKNHHPPPSGMPFVTISGYNHALVALTHLTKAESLEVAPAASNSLSKLELTIGQKLGGHSIDHSLFLEETSRFCSLDAASLIQTYHIDEHYHKVQCLQLVYINKLLTEFYKFDPNTSWKQIKFLLAPPEGNAGGLSPSVDQEATFRESNSKHPECQSGSKMDIGWTLGLLLNATSNKFEESPSGAAPFALDNGGTLAYHHGTSVMFILRATLLLMVACILLATCFIVTAMVSVQHQQRKAYISPTETSPRNSVQSSWCSSIDQV